MPSFRERIEQRLDAGLRKELKSILQPPMRQQLVYVAARLGIPDLVAGGPKGSEELARLVGAHHPTLHRVLRGMVSIGLLGETADGRFGASTLSEMLRTDRSDSLRNEAIFAGETFPAWGALLHSVRTGETPFDHVLGRGLFSHFADDPALEMHFGASMAALTAAIAAEVAGAWDFSTLRCLVEVGGGYGTLLAAILSRNPSLRGILFDLPQTIGGARERLPPDVVGRCDLVPGDFFESVPAGGDAYVLQLVIHDWDDERAALILTNCRRAMGEQGRLLLVERLLPERVEQARNVVRGDVNMLVLTGGRERAEGEYRSLLAASGFRWTRTIPTASACVIEAVPGAPSG